MTKRDIEIVIPSIKSSVRTLESIPDEIRVHVERDGTLNEARNSGVAKTESDIVAIMDDDIAFEPAYIDFLTDLIEEHPDRLAGLADDEFGLCLGRTLVFRRELWERIGGFDETLRSHNGDTDFVVRAHKAGTDIVRIPTSAVDHADHERSIRTRDRAWRLVYLCAKHPRYAPLLAGGTAVFNVQLALGVDLEMAVPTSDTSGAGRAAAESVPAAAQAAESFAPDDSPISVSEPS